MGFFLLRAPAFKISMIWGLAFGTALVADLQAFGDELSQYQACMKALVPATDGPGDQIGGAERVGFKQVMPPAPRTTLAIPGNRRVNGRDVEGMWFYTDENVYFTPQRKTRERDLFGFHFDLKLPDREPFHCNTSDQAASWSDARAHRFRRGTTCLAYDDPNERDYYHSLKPQPLPATAGDRFAVIRTAVLLRIDSLVLKYQQEAAKYREDLESYRRCENEAGIGGLLRSVAGIAPVRPVPPSPESRFRVLGACAFPEDEVLRGRIRSAESLISNLPIPRYDPSAPRSCGGS